MPVADELLGPLIELLEVIGRVIEVLAPVEAEPSDVALDLVDVLLRLLHRVRVVEAEIAVAAELLRDAEVDADRLGVADVQPAVRLGRKPRDDGAAVLARDARSCATISRMKSRGGASGRLSALGLDIEGPILAYGRMAGQCDAK